MNACNLIDHNSTFIQPSQPGTCQNLLVALSVISLLGSLIATGCLFPKMGYWSFSIGGAGIAITSILLCIRYRFHFAKEATPQEEIDQPSPCKALPTMPDTFQPNPISPIDPSTEPLQPLVSFSNDMIHPYMKYLVALYYPQATISEEEHCFPIEELESRMRSLNKITDDYQRFNYPFCISVADSHFALVYINRTKRRVEYYGLKTRPEHPKIQKELTRIAEILTREEPGNKPFELKISIRIPQRAEEHLSGIWVLYCLKDRLDEQKMYISIELKIPFLVSRAIQRFTQAVLKSMQSVNALVKQAKEEELAAYSKYYSDPNADKYLKCYEEDCSKIHHVKRLAQLLRGIRLDPTSAQSLLAAQALPDTCLLQQKALWSKNPPPTSQIVTGVYNNFGEHGWLEAQTIYLYMQFLVSPHYPQNTLPQTSCPLGHGMAKKARILCCPISSLMKNIQMLNQETLNYKKVNCPFVIHVTGNHWTLVYINRSKRTIEYYDSKINYGGSEYPKIVNELTRIAAVLTEEEPGVKPFKLELKITTVLQPDSFQCGIWVLYFLDKIFNNPNLDFNNLIEPEKIIAKYRIEVINRISQMLDIEDQAQNQELSDYEKYYKDKTIGSALYFQERRQQKCLLRWKQLAECKLLTPRSILIPNNGLKLSQSGAERTHSMGR